MAPLDSALVFPASAPGAAAADPGRASDSDRRALRFDDPLPSSADVVIVGGGFCGLMCMVHVVRHEPDATVAVIERTPRQAPGPAYGACRPEHLLNVPAGRMGAFAEDPFGFVRWLRDAGLPG